MEKLTHLTSIAAPLLENNIDTDIIFPARFLLLPDREGLGQYAFHERRRVPGSVAGSKASSDFILDQPAYKKARILVTGSSFGAGSSREQAVWALADLGIRCVIAPSFGEIFFANCFKNGVLPVVAGGDGLARCEAAALGAETLNVDVKKQTITFADGAGLTFELTHHQSQALLLGLDDAGMILAEDLAAIEAFEGRRAIETPWLDINIRQDTTRRDITTKDEQPSKTEPTYANAS